MKCKVCGKEYPDVIILDNNPLSVTAYLTWKEDLDFHDESCFGCFSKDDSNKHKIRQNRRRL